MLTLQKRNSLKKTVESIAFASISTDLGYVLVAQSNKGLCSILLGSDPYVLEMELKKRFPNACLEQKEAELKEVLSQVEQVLLNPLLKMAFPLDERGTDFQKKVWQALREIPVGTTASYSDIAKRIGHPKAVRAVAGACASNALAMITPCHRVIRTDGSLSGYRWGIHLKQKLLELEETLVKY